MEEKIYFVIDMKSFYASVECALRGLNPFTTKLVVADEERSQGTICLAVSPALKALGVKNRCRLYEIPKKIDYIIAKPRMKRYIEYASEIYGIYLQYIDKRDIHIYSIDECFIDVSSYMNLYNTTPKDFALKLMREIKEKLHIPSATGIGTNMFLAKVALDILAKKDTDGIGYLDEKKFRSELWHHKPITDFWMIADGTERRLMKLGLETMFDVAHASEQVLYQTFGINATFLIDHAWGREPCTMVDIKRYQSKSQSLSHSQILPCNYNYIDALTIVKEMTISSCYELYKKRKVVNSINIYIGYGDHIAPFFSKGHINMSSTTNLFCVMEQYVVYLYNSIVDTLRPIRKISISFGNLLPIEYEFYDLFVDMNKVAKEKRTVESVLAIHDKFGKNSLLKGINFQKNATQIARNKTIGGHNSE